MDQKTPYLIIIQLQGIRYPVYCNVNKHLFNFTDCTNAYDNVDPHIVMGGLFPGGGQRTTKL